MLEMFANIMKAAISVIAVILLIVGVIIGVAYVEATYWYPTGFNYFVGGAIGFVAAFILDVITFGFIGLIYDIRDNIESLNYKVQKLIDAQTNTKPIMNSRTPSAPTANNPSSVTVRCKACGEPNLSNRCTCKKCGAEL